jgi:hypothetical protein
VVQPRFRRVVNERLALQSRIALGVFGTEISVLEFCYALRHAPRSAHGTHAEKITMSHKSVQALFDGYVKDPSQVVIDDIEAISIYQLFMGYPLPPGHANKPGAKAFLQAAMTGALDASNDIGWVQALWQGTATPSASLKSAIGKLVRAFGKKLFTDAFAEEPKIYVSVLNTIKWQHRTRFEAITQLDEVF